MGFPPPLAPITGGLPEAQLPSTPLTSCLAEGNKGPGGWSWTPSSPQWEGQRAKGPRGLVPWTSKLREDTAEEAATEDFVTLLGTDHATWGQLGLVLYLLKRASTKQRKPIY